MKTFKDRMSECENPKGVMKWITVDGSKIEFTAEDLKSTILQDGLLAGTTNFVQNKYVRREDRPTLMATLRKINDDTLQIEVTQECECGGAGEIDCLACDGLGSHYCSDCDDEHDCSKCDGSGGVECNCIENPIDNEEILYSEIITLNQGELF